MTIEAFDIDDVLFPYREVIVRSLEDRFGVKINGTKYISYGIISCLNSTHPELIKELKRSGGKLAHLRWVSKNTNLLHETPPNQGVVEFIFQRRKEGAKIAIVTARGKAEEPDCYFDRCVELTTSWLIKYGINFDYIRFSHNKQAALREIEVKSRSVVRYIVEDHPANVAELVFEGRMVMLPDKTYNQRELVSEESDNETYRKIGFTQEQWYKALDSGRVYRIKDLREISDLI